MDLYQFRKHRSLTQEQLAQELGIPRSVLCQYETGARRPSRQTLHRIEQLLNACLDDAPYVRTQTLSQRFPNPKPRLAPPGRSPSWQRLAQQHPELLTRLGKPPDEWVSWIATDSALECLAWLQLYRAGAKLHYQSPLIKGYPGPPLVGDQLKGAHPRSPTHPLAPLPCLYLDQPPVAYVAWPQASIRTAWKTYRLDALMLIAYKQQRAWCALEIDGPGHRFDQDERRTESIGMPFLRFVSAEIYDLHFAEHLNLAIQDLLSRNNVARQSGEPTDVAQQCRATSRRVGGWEGGGS